MSASIYDKLTALCDEIETDITAKSFDKNIRTELADLKDRAYLDRSPEAEFATQLYRKYRDLSSDHRTTSNEGFDGSVLGTATYLSQPGRPFYYFDKITEGSSETLVGSRAPNTHIFRLRVTVLILQIVAFIVLAANDYVHQGYNLTTSYMLAKCPVVSSSIEGRFDMRLFQFICALSFLIFFFNFTMVVYYMLPIDEDSGRKTIPGFQNSVERALTTIDSPSTSQRMRTFFETLSFMCFKNAKSIELYFDAALLLITTIVLIIGSIEVDRGAAFRKENENVWYTLGTFYMTYGNCMDNPDPATSIRVVFAMMYIACLVSSLTVKYSYDSFQKYKLLHNTSDGSMTEIARDESSLHVGRSLIANQDDTDDIVQVDL